MKLLLVRLLMRMVKWLKPEREDVIEFTWSDDCFEYRVEIGSPYGFDSYTPMRSLVIWRNGEAGFLRWHTERDPGLAGLLFYPVELRAKILDIVHSQSPAPVRERHDEEA